MKPSWRWVIDLGTHPSIALPITVTEKLIWNA
jgi:hypothetical protein